jgi:hypothetical protein
MRRLNILYIFPVINTLLFLFFLLVPLRIYKGNILSEIYINYKQQNSTNWQKIGTTEILEIKQTGWLIPRTYVKFQYVDKNDDIRYGESVFFEKKIFLNKTYPIEILPNHKYLCRLVGSTTIQYCSILDYGAFLILFLFETIVLFICCAVLVQYM